LLTLIHTALALHTPIQKHTYAHTHTSVCLCLCRTHKKYTSTPLYTHTSLPMLALHAQIIHKHTYTHTHTGLPVLALRKQIVHKHTSNTHIPVCLCLHCSRGLACLCALAAQCSCLCFECFQGFILQPLSVAVAGMGVRWARVGNGYGQWHACWA